jgi:pentatricopeptide repeat protein
MNAYCQIQMPDQMEKLLKLAEEFGITIIAPDGT